MKATKLKPPIILIGNYRSGTTIAQRLIGLHPEVVTWYEPRTLWRYADPGRRHDEFGQADASDSVLRYIRAQFLAYQTQNGDRRVVENTPSNVLSVPYVHAVFPEATFLYITRNPFSVINSLELQWHKTKTVKGLLRTLRHTPLTQLPFYGREFLVHFVIRKLRKKNDTTLVGPRYEGIERDLKELGKMAVIARQWAVCNRKAREDLAQLGDGRSLTFRYEDLVRDPEPVVRRIYEHCGLDCTEEIIGAARQMVDPGRQEKWRRLDPAELKRIVPAIREEMAICGYELPEMLR